MTGLAALLIAPPAIWLLSRLWVIFRWEPARGTIVHAGKVNRGEGSTLVFLVDLVDGQQVSVDEPFVGRRLRVGDKITVWGSPGSDETYRGGSIVSLLAIPSIWLSVAGVFALVTAGAA